ASTSSSRSGGGGPRRGGGGCPGWGGKQRVRGGRKKERANSGGPLKGGPEKRPEEWLPWEQRTAQTPRTPCPRLASKWATMPEASRIWKVRKLPLACRRGRARPRRGRVG